MVPWIPACLGAPADEQIKAPFQQQKQRDGEQTSSKTANHRESIQKTV